MEVVSVHVYLANVIRANVWFLPRLKIVVNQSKHAKMRLTQNTTVHDAIFNSFNAQWLSSTSQQHNQNCRDSSTRHYKRKSKCLLSTEVGDYNLERTFHNYYLKEK
ncbi:uncharacterized protein LOC130819562 [Amaranthus tricolor]|uniref:uncharacterized protein LOC130819562 n=1 Tax=Amaranthus tricolor TaxID=29722 RepID=UPI00258952BA|nr:uncharacterized protein LOC130819562 [Amaranthus tricolor]